MCYNQNYLIKPRKGGEKMIIFVVLSDTLLWGIRKTTEYVADRYGQVIANLYSERLYRNRDRYNRLLRGEISEEDYWMSVRQGTPVSVREAEGFYTKALMCAKPGLMEILNSIKSHPSQIPSCKGRIEYGRPDVQLLCDYNKERKSKIREFHSDLFEECSRSYWSFEYRQIVPDKGYLERILNVAGVGPKEAFLVAGEPFSTTAASLAGIPNQMYVNPDRFKKHLLEYGFEL